METLNPYPSEGVRHVLDKNGAEFEIRPLHPGDETLLRNFYLGLGEETISSFFRCHMDKKVLTDEKNLKKICKMNYHSCLYLIVIQRDSPQAVHDDEIIGMGALFLPLSNAGASEVAHLIADAHQRKGIGTILMEILLSYAKNHQVGDSVFAQTAIGNIGSKKLLEKFGFVVKSAEDGEINWSYKIR